MVQIHSWKVNNYIARKEIPRFYGNLRFNNKLTNIHKNYHDRAYSVYTFTPGSTLPFLFIYA
jgi:hypothetical protein